MLRQVMRSLVLPNCRRVVPAPLPSLRNGKSVHTSLPLGEYEGDGQTTVTVLNHEYDSPLMVDSYNQNGFRLNNGFAVAGPMALFPKTVLSWDVGSCKDVTPDSLALFTLLEPKLDILVIGLGDKGDQIPKETLKLLRSKKISFEILTTEHACTTFNFLNVEKRCVAAALIPPRHIRFYEEDVLRTRLERKKTLQEMDFPLDSPHFK